MGAEDTAVTVELKSSNPESTTTTDDVKSSSNDTDSATSVISKKMKDLGNIIQTSDNENDIKEACDGICEECCQKDAPFEIMAVEDIPCILYKALQKWETNDKVVAQILSAMHNTSLSQDMATTYVVVIENAFPLVVNCMEQYPDNLPLQTRGLGGVGLMIKMNEPEVMVPLIKELGITTVFRNAMINHPDDAKLHRWALKGLDNMTKLTELIPDYLNDNILSVVGISYDKFKNELLYGKDIEKFTWSILRALVPPEEED